MRVKINARVNKKLIEQNNSKSLKILAKFTDHLARHHEKWGKTEIINIRNER